MSFLLPKSALFSCLTAALCAQAPVFVPAHAAAAEGDSARMVEGLGHAGRQQILLAASHLASAQGHDLISLSFRRDHTGAFAGDGGEVDLVLRVAAAGRPVHAPAVDLAANAPGAVEVFRGRLTLPVASATAAASTAWSGDNVVTIPFALPYAYAGGDLCVDLEGTPVGGAPVIWYPDAVADDVAGVVTPVGFPCGSHTDFGGQRNASVAAAELIPGETPRFNAWGTPGALAFLGLGVGVRSSTIDLGFIGAPGCGLGIDPVVTLPTVVSAPLFDQMTSGLAILSVPLPNQSSLLATHLGAQWFEFAGSSLTTTEALDCRIAARLPNLGMAVVSQEAGRAAAVDLTRAPVLRFGVR